MDDPTTVAGAPRESPTREELANVIAWLRAQLEEILDPGVGGAHACLWRRGRGATGGKRPSSPTFPRRQLEEILEVVAMIDTLAQQR